MTTLIAVAICLALASVTACTVVLLIGAVRALRRDVRDRDHVLHCDMAALWREVEDLHDRRVVPLRRIPEQRRPDGDAS